MADIVFLQAYVDFTSPHSLADVARWVAETCFGGGAFVGLDEYILDEVPAMRLDRLILGLEVVLGGGPETGGFTLEVRSKEPLAGGFPRDGSNGVNSICEFSRYLADLVRQIPDVEVDD